METISKEKIIIGTPGYVIYFDNVRVDKYVKSFNVDLSCDGTIGSASIEMMYIPDLYYRRTANSDNFLSYSEGIDNMTNCKIFVKNIFSGKYTMVFDGNIKSKSLSKMQGSYSLNFTASDYLTWLNKTIVALQIPITSSLTDGDKLKWKVEGINPQDPQIKKIQTVNDAGFMGETLKSIVKRVVKQTLLTNNIYIEADSVAMWDEAVHRIAVMGDIDADLREKKVLDFVLDSTSTEVSSIYVMINDILKSLLFEFYQDRDGVIRIKPPYWNEKLLKDHIVDPSLIVSYNESINWNNYYTRIIVTGGLADYQSSSNDTAQSMLTPVAAYAETTSGGISTDWLNTTTSSSSSSSSSRTGIDTSGWPSVMKKGSTGSSVKALQKALNDLGYSAGKVDGVFGSGTEKAVKAYQKKNGLTQDGVVGPITKAKMSGKTTSSSSSGHVGVVDVAMRYLGLPYKWGGTSPSTGFDCSGFVQYCFKQVGIKISRTTSTQYKQGTGVSASSLQQGDLVFYNGPDGLHSHVAMYIGNGQVIHSPHTGDVVKISNLHMMTIYCCRRIAGATGSSSSGGSYSVGNDEFLKPTDIEKKYGISVYDASQPLIKVTNYNVIDANQQNVAGVLKNYAKFMIDLLNSAVCVASMQTMAMPWIRPGFNLWVDPISVDKVFYVSGISHQGTAEGGVYTSFRLSMGRPSLQFSNSVSTFGAMREGTTTKRDNVFINQVDSGFEPEKFGTVLSGYSDFKKTIDDFVSFYSGNTEVVHAENSSFYAKYYGSTSIDKFNYGGSTSKRTTTKSDKYLIDTWSSILRKGNKNGSVSHLQQFLTDYGYNPKGVDGKFGTNTEKAVKAFQKASGLKQDGIVGAKTKAKMKTKEGYSAGGSTTVTSPGVTTATGDPFAYTKILAEEYQMSDSKADNHLPTVMDKIYNSAPAVVKARAAKVKAIIALCENYIDTHYISES